MRVISEASSGLLLSASRSRTIASSVLSSWISQLALSLLASGLAESTERTFSTSRRASTMLPCCAYIRARSTLTLFSSGEAASPSAGWFSSTTACMSAIAPARSPPRYLSWASCALNIIGGRRPSLRTRSSSAVAASGPRNCRTKLISWLVLAGSSDSASLRRNASAASRSLCLT